MSIFAMPYFYLFLFLGSSCLLYFSGGAIVNGLSRIARFLNVREFVVAFFVMAFASSLPNLFVGLNSAFQGISELSFGDIGGNNLVAMTLAVAFAVLFAKKHEIATTSPVIQATSLFTAIIAILPLFLLMDGILSRADGVILILFFFFYNVWLFAKRERFGRVYDDTDEKRSPIERGRLFFKDTGKVLAGIVLLIIAAQGIVSSAVFFAGFFGVPVILIGLLITGLGSSLPETYFAVVSARRGETQMILGNLMGSVIVPSTLVLGIVTLIHPVVLYDPSLFATARIFLIAAALFFFFFVKKGRRVTKSEALFLLLLYIFFIVTEFAMR